MRKNFMLSLAAMAALPMAGLADTTWQVSKDPANDWEKKTSLDGTKTEIYGNASDSETILGIGAGISRTVELPKGKYKVECVATNATLSIKVGGAPATLDNNGYFTLDITKEVTLEFNTEEPKTQFSIKGLHFVLDYDFDTFANYASRLLGEAKTHLDAIEGNETSWANLLRTDFRTLEADLQKLQNVDNATTEDNGVKVGEQVFELYKTYKLYDYGTKDLSKMEQSFAALCEAAQIINAVDGWKTDVQTAYKNNESHAATKEKYESIVNGEGGFIAELDGKLTEWEQNYNDHKALSYSAVNSEYDAKAKNLAASIPAYKVAYEDLEASKAKNQEYLASFDQKMGTDEKYATLHAKAKSALSDAFTSVYTLLSTFSALDNSALMAFKSTDYTNACKTSANAMDKVLSTYNGYYDTLSEEYAKIETKDEQGELVSGYKFDVKFVKTANSKYNSTFGVNIQGYDYVEDSYLGIIAIEEKITEIETKLEAAVKAISADKDLEISSEIEELKTTVENALSTLETNATNANTWVANYKALTGQLDDVKKAFQDANDPVKTYVVEGYYDGPAIWADYATNVKENPKDADSSLQDRINACVFGKEDPSIYTGEYKDTWASKMTTLSNDISEYAEKAKAAYEKYAGVKDGYVGLKKELEDWKDAYSKVNGIVGTKSLPIMIWEGEAETGSWVPMKNENGEEVTYKEELDKVSSTLQSQESDLSAALKLKGLAHYNAIVGLDELGTQPFVLSVNEENYQASWNQYVLPSLIADANNQMQSVNQEAKKIYNELTAAKAKFENDKSLYGKQYTASIANVIDGIINGVADPNDKNIKKGGFKNIFGQIIPVPVLDEEGEQVVDEEGNPVYEFSITGKINDSGEYVCDTLPKTATSADLNEYLKMLDSHYVAMLACSGALETLNDSAKVIKAAVAKNQTLYNTYLKYYDGSKSEKIDSFTELAKAELAKSKDTNRSTEDGKATDEQYDLNKEYRDIDSDIQEYKTTLDNYLSNESIKTNEKDIEDRRDAIYTAIATFASNVANSNANYQAYQDQTTAYEKLFEGDVDKAYKAYLSISMVANAGHDYYAKKAKDLSALIADLGTQIETYYTEEESAKHTNDITDATNGTVAYYAGQVAKVLSDCDSNDYNYNQLQKDLGLVKVQYDTAKGLFNKDESDITSGWLHSLENINSDIDDNTSYIETVFGEGGLVTEGAYTKYSAIYTGYSSDITTLVSQWKGDNDSNGYYKQVTEANSKTHSQFTTACTDLWNKYQQEYLSNLKKFENVNDPSYNDILADFYADLYKLATTDLDVLKATELEAYKNVIEENNSKNITKESLTFLSDEHYQAVSDLQDEITSKYEECIEALNETAFDNFDKLANEVSAAISSAKNSILACLANLEAKDENNKSYNFVEAEFNKLSDIVSVQTSKKSNYDFALNDYAGCIATLNAICQDSETAKSGIYTAKEHIAQEAYSQWSMVWEAAQKDMVSKAGDAKYASYANGTIGGIDYKSAFDNAYNDYIVPAKEQYEKALSKYGVIADVNTAKTNFETNNKYQDFLAKVANRDKSEEAYKAFTKSEDNLTKIKAIQARITDAETKAKAFGACNIGIPGFIATAKTAIDYFGYVEDEFTGTELKADRDACNLHLENAEEELPLDVKLKDADQASTGLLAKLNSAEASYLSDQIVRLQKDVLNAENVDMASFNKDISALSSRLSEIASQKVVNGIEVPVYTDEEKYNKYVVLQSDLSDLRTTTLHVNSENLATAIEQAIQTGSDKYTDAATVYDDLFPFQQEDVAKGAPTDMSADLRAQLEANVENNTLVFNAESMQKTANDQVNTLQVYNLKVQAAKKKKDAYVGQVDDLKKELEGYNDSFEELSKVIEDFDSSVQEKFEVYAAYFTKNYNSNSQKLDLTNVDNLPKSDEELAAGKKFQYDWEQTSETETSGSETGESETTPVRVAAVYGSETETSEPETGTSESVTLPEGVTDFATFLTVVEKACYNDQAVLLLDNFMTNTGIAVQDGQITVPEGYDRIYKQTDLQDEYNTISSKIDHLNEYRKDAWNSFVTIDKDGNETPSTSVNFVEECKGIFSDLDGLNENVENLKKSIEDNAYLRGDIDDNKRVTVGDYSKAILHALEKKTLEDKAFAAADVNENGDVNIQDVTLIIGVMFGEPLSAPSRVAIPNAVTADALSIMVESEGVHQRIGIMLSAEQVYAGCQMDILLPEGVTLVDETVGEMAGALSLSSNDLENGSHRILLSSADGMTMTTGNGAMLWLDVEVDHNYSGEGIALSNILFSNSAGRGFELSVVNGETTGLSNVSMTQEVKEKIYSVGGILMDGLKRGVNIIRGNDGSSKKIVK